MGATVAERARQWLQSVSAARLWGMKRFSELTEKLYAEDPEARDRVAIELEQLRVIQAEHDKALAERDLD
jgi:hypothetical protein